MASGNPLELPYTSWRQAVNEYEESTRRHGGASYGRRRGVRGRMGAADIGGAVVDKVCVSYFPLIHDGGDL